MNVFEFRDRVIADYGAYIKSFISIRDGRIRERVETDLEGGLLWPEPRIGLNPAFAEGAWIDELVQQKVLHSECARIFRIKPTAHDAGTGLKLHQHQLEAVHAAKRGHNYVLTTGTGSGKSLAYIVPIVDAILKRGPHKGIQAIVVYPMNALANSQERLRAAGNLVRYSKKFRVPHASPRLPGHPRRGPGHRPRTPRRAAAGERVKVGEDLIAMSGRLWYVEEAM
jgi:ATP-dependent helicase YprA (DUF1998 family)